MKASRMKSKYRKYELVSPLGCTTHPNAIFASYVGRIECTTRSQSRVSGASHLARKTKTALSEKKNSVRQYRL